MTRPGHSPGAAVVTGGSTGIGQAICEELLAAGWEVISLARRPCPIAHERLHSVAVDLADPDATAEAARHVTAQYPVTAIVHNAGVIRAALLPEVQLGDLDFLVKLHLGCAIQLVQAALPHMRAQHFGRVVLIASRAALGLQTRTSYSATKAGMIGMARTWALELAADGITTNVVAPGPIHNTEMFEKVITPGSEREQKLAQNIPVGRLGEPGDVARAVGFFANPQNGFVNGQVLFVCGGASVGTITI